MDYKTSFIGTLLVCGVFIVVFYSAYDSGEHGIPQLCWNKRQGKTIRQYPKAVIIGVAKAGTSALRTYLSLHPDIEASPIELKYFNLDERFQRGLSWYKSKMPLSRPDQITIEKSPNYISSPTALLRLHAFNSSMKLLVIVRDPVVRALSHFVHNSRMHKTYKKGSNKSKLKETSAGFEKAVLLTNASRVDSDSPYIQKSVYISYMIVLYKIFKREQVYVVNGDRLISDPSFEMKKIEKFLGVHPYISSKNFYFNKSRNFFCTISFCNKKQCLKRSKGRTHPVLRNSTVDKLTEYFRPFNRDLFNLIEDDFGWPV